MRGFSRQVAAVDRIAAAVAVHAPSLSLEVRRQFDKVQSPAATWRLTYAARDSFHFLLIYWIAEESLLPIFPFTLNNATDARNT